MSSYYRVAVWNLTATLALVTCQLPAPTLAQSPESKSVESHPTDATSFLLRDFARQQLTDVYFAEGVSVGDLNADGHQDVVYGPYWFAGPDFKKKLELYAAKPQPMEGYADHFFSWVHDFNNDAAPDVLVVGFPGTPAYVYENPGAERAEANEHWAKHEVLDWVSNESPQFVNLIAEPAGTVARPELVCTRDGFFGFAKFDPAQPFSKWNFYPVSEQIAAAKFGHGLGIGDINGDGLSDIIHAGGWFEQPAASAVNGRWKSHQANFSSGGGGAEMHAYDVDGDGDSDVITSESAHNFGLSWYEQTSANQFQQHVIVGSHASENKYGVLFSEPHSVHLADIDQDGLQDIVTGKTYWSHHRQSPMWDAGAVVYWFKLVRTAEQQIDWVPYLANREAGIGRQVITADVNADGMLDIITGGMLGANVLTQQTSAVSAAEFHAAQPEIYQGPQIRVVQEARAKRGTRSPIGSSGNVEQAVEGETLGAEVTAGSAKPQGMKNFSADRWSNNSQLWWTGARPGDVLTIQLDAFQDIEALQLALTCARDYAIVELGLDGKPLGEPIDLFSEQVITTGLLEFETPGLKAGKHELSITIVGANRQAAKSYMVGLDYVRFRASGQTFPEPDDNWNPPETLANDEYPHQGLDAETAASSMIVPTGFRVIAAASEPDVRQPIAMAMDHRGRIWVAEAYEYPQRAESETGCDRILVFEDTTGDGQLDSRKVFYEGLNLVSGLEVGFGGVWVGAAPYLLFIPDANGDDIPDAAPEVLLDGWGYQDTHETLNAFCWGPDGWLYGCHGVFTHSKVGPPGTAQDQRTPINAGVWRYHPTQRQFEVFAHGTSNPWGVDFNSYGEAFVTACVIPHLYHIIPGARYQRQAGQHFNPHTYADIPTIADHLHYLGATPHTGNGKSDEAGGGHAHAGAMFYQGDLWPKEYHGALFMNNIHGQRLNTDLLAPAGSGYVGSHGPDFLKTGDMASQILNMRVGPDGNVWMIDWYDMQACHRREVEVHDRSNGRIYKICYEGELATGRDIIAVNLANKSDLELAELCLHSNNWHVKHARQLLQERAASRTISVAAIARLVEIATSDAAVPQRLRAIWARNAIGALDNTLLERLHQDSSPQVRAWAIRLRSQQQPTASDEALLSLARLAAEDPSPVVRLAVASAADSLPVAKRWDIVAALASHAEDASDHNLPLMIWYVMEPLAEDDPDRALALAMSAGENIPLLRDFMLRRLGGAGGQAAIERLASALSKETAPARQLTFLSAIKSSLVGQRDPTPPVEWPAIYAKLTAVGDHSDHNNDHDRILFAAKSLAVSFGDAQAVEQLVSTLMNDGSEPAIRVQAADVLIAARVTDLDGKLLTLVEQTATPETVRLSALRGLARYDDDTIGPRLLRSYADLSNDAQRAAVATLCSRVASARLLLSEIEAGRIASADLTADMARQLEYFEDPQLSQQLASAWGQIRKSSSAKMDIINDYTRLVAQSDLPAPDPSLGRAIYAKTCGRCHVLYGVGEPLGPDLTGSNRSNLDYLLENIVDPSAVMANEYRQSIFLTEDGQVLTGIVRAETENAVTIQTAETTVVLPRDEIAQRKISEQSMMPENQLEQFSPHEIRSLLAYLRGSQQVAPATTPPKQ